MNLKPVYSDFFANASVDVKNFTITETPGSAVTETYPGLYHAAVNITGAHPPLSLPR